MARIVELGLAGLGGGHRRRGGWGESFGEEEGFGGGFGGRGQHRRGRSRMFAGGELRLVLLKLINDGSRHGYELIKAIEELTGGTYAPSPGVVYPTLSLLLDEGMIASAEDGGARKAFSATDEGRAELTARAEEAEALVARLTALGETRERGDSPPVRRAIGNLFTALRQRAASGELDRDTAHAIADILDEAARKIERL